MELPPNSGGIQEKVAYCTLLKFTTFYWNGSSSVLENVSLGITEGLAKRNLGKIHGVRIA